MATSSEVQKWRAALKSRIPLIGSMRRRGAMAEVESSANDVRVVRLLMEVLSSSDEEIARRADQALRGLALPAAVDVLCAEWAKSRDRRLESIVVEKKYVASKPLELRLLTALKCGKRMGPVPPRAVPLLLPLIDDSDATIATGAESSLREQPEGEARDALCDLAIREPKGTAARICVEQQFRHTDPRQNALLLFVTEQLEEYFEEDYEFQELRPAYDEADEAVKGHVLAVVRGGDRRCAAFFGTKSKSLLESSDHEIQLALDGFLQHENYSELFQACLQLPLKYGVRILENLSKTDWQPDDPQLASLYKELVREVAGTQLPPPREPSAESSLFERWLAEGRAMVGQSTSKLQGMLDGDSPIEGVKAVGALASMGSVSEQAASAIRGSKHWLVRLAGHATGASIDITRDNGDEENLWIRDLVTGEDVLEFSPARAKPDDLERLNQAPREAFAGRLGGMRRALRCLMTYQVDTLVARRPTKRAADDAATFVRPKKS